MDNTDLRGKCIGGSGERCDLHFIVENEVVQTKHRVDKLEKRTDESYSTLTTTLNDLSLKMGTYIATQEYKDTASQEMRNKTLNNSEEINELKSTVKSVEEHNKSVSESLSRIDRNLSILSNDFKDMDKTIVDKEGITEIVNNAIVADKNQDKDRWFDTLWVKISAGVSVLSFIAFFTVKIVVTLLAL